MRTFIVSTLLASALPAWPQPAPPDEIPMADYLGLLEQIAPAARQGAEAYLQAALQRCRRTVSVAELRRAMSEGSGDPVLMGLIRASQLRDARAVAEWASRVECGRSK